MYIDFVFTIKVTIIRIYSNTGYILDVLKTLPLYVGRITRITYGRTGYIAYGRITPIDIGRTPEVDVWTDRGGV